MNGLDLVAWLLILLAALDVGVTIVLVRAARRVGETALQERATISVLLTAGAIGAAIMSAAYLTDTSLASGISFGLLVTVLVIVSAPQLVWYALYRLGRFQ